MAEQEPTPLEEALAAAVEAESQAEARLSQLEEMSRQAMLSEAQEIEAIRLERRTRNLAAVITQLEEQIAQQRETLDIDAFCAAWLPTVEHKRELYQQFAQDVQQLWRSLAAILGQHEAQLAGLQTLPPRLQRFMLDNFLPDTGTLKARVAQAMGNPAWSQVLLAPGDVRVASAEQLMEHDPGTRALPPRLISNAINSSQPIDRSA